MSLGSGTCATEQDFSTDHAILCLDKDARSLLAACANLREKEKGERNMLVTRFDISDETQLSSLIHGLQEKVTEGELIVLFQHPSPAISSRDTYRNAGKAVVNAIRCNMVSKCVIVYDFQSGRGDKYWDAEELEKTFLHFTGSSGIVIQQPELISDMHEDTVFHPLASNYIFRKGWARMKKGQEMYLCLSAKLYATMPNGSIVSVVIKSL